MIFNEYWIYTGYIVIKANIPINGKKAIIIQYIHALC